MSAPVLTQHDLAQSLSVSQQAVSYALRGMPGVSEKTRERVLKAAEAVGYRPSSAALAMREGRTHNIGVVLHSLGIDSGGGHAYDTISGINHVIEPAGYTTCLVQMIDVEAGRDGMSRVFREQALDGMIVHAAVFDEVRERLDDLSSRIIWCDAGVQEPRNCLWRDEQEAGRLVGQAVAEAGYRRAVFVSDFGRRDGHPYRHRALRLAGVRAGLEPAGVEVAVSEIDPLDAPGTDERFARALREAGPHTAWITCDYTQAQWLAHLCEAVGLGVGRDVPLACCDDRDIWSRYWPHLSRARFDRFAMGKRAATMMLRLLEDDRPSPASIDQPRWISPADGTCRRPTLPAPAAQTP